MEKGPITCGISLQNIYFRLVFFRNLMECIIYCNISIFGSSALPRNFQFVVSVMITPLTSNQLRQCMLVTSVIHIYSSIPHEVVYTFM